MMRVILIVLVLAAGCGGTDEPMPLEDFCAAYADAWCEVEAQCADGPIVCYHTAHVNQCLADHACEIDVPYASECLDAIDGWDCARWVSECDSEC